MDNGRIQTFREFWPFYVSQHLDPTCRALHFVASTFALACLATVAATRDPRFLLLGLVGSYGFAWIGHFVFEKNRPATFKYPLWSFAADWVMYAHMWTGRLQPELDRARALHS